MTKTKVWAILTAFAVLAVFGLGYFVAVSPLKSDAAKANNEAVTAQSANDDLRVKIARLKKEETKVPADQARIAAIETRVPATPALPAYIRFLTTAAAAAHVDLLSIAPSAPTAVLTKAAAVAPVTSGTAAGSSEAPAPAPAAAPTSAMSAVTVTYNVVGNYFALQAFLRQLEKSPRVTVVSTINVTPGALLKAAGDTSAIAPQWQTLAAQITATIFTSALPADSIAVAPPTTSSPGTSAAPAASAGSTAAPNS